MVRISETPKNLLVADDVFTSYVLFVFASPVLIFDTSTGFEVQRRFFAPKTLKSTSRVTPSHEAPTTRLFPCFAVAFSGTRHVLNFFPSTRITTSTLAVVHSVDIIPSPSRPHGILKLLILKHPSPALLVALVCKANRPGADHFFAVFSLDESPAARARQSVPPYHYHSESEGFASR